MDVQVRVTLEEDCSALEQLGLALFGCNLGTSHLLETSLLCLTAIDKTSNTLVGFLCLEDVPIAHVGSELTITQQQWLHTASNNQPYDCHTAYIKVHVACQQDEVNVSAALFRASFASLPLVNKLLIAVPNSSSTALKGIATFLKPASASGAENAPLHLQQLLRSDLLVPLNMRVACVEDHDDMLPVLQRAEARFPALAKLPESSRPAEAFALTRVVASQDASNVVLVAHAETSGSQSRKADLAGFIVLTSEVDISSLTDVFDLHPFDNFLEEDVYDAQMDQARESLRVKKRNTLEAKLGNRVLRVAQEDEQTQQAETTNDEVTVPVEEQIDITAACEPTEEEVRAEMTMLFDAAEQTPSVFAVTMACIEPEYDTQILDFLRQAFEAFPGKKYCLLTLPHNAVEPPLVAHFTRLAPLPGAIFPEVLYVFHRDALVEGFSVRLAASQDAEGVSMLIAGMPNSSDIREIFDSALARNTAVVATVQRQVVGLVTISDQVDVPLLQTHYDLSAVLRLQSHPTTAQGEIDMVCMNPIFAHHARSLVSGAHRLLQKTVLYYALPPAQPPPDILNIMSQVPPRPVPSGETESPEFALYLVGRRHAFSPRQAVNAQIVVVGASEAGIATIERLLMDPRLFFTHITLLAPGGISVAGLANHYTAGVLAKLGLDARIAVVDGEMVGLDTASQVIELADGSQLPYNLLLISSGLQEPSYVQLAESDSEAANNVVTAQELATGFSVADGETMKKVLVYGNSLEAYHALATLDANGAGQKAVFYAPPEQQDPGLVVLKQCESSLGMDLPQPLPGTLLAMVPIPGSARWSAVFQAVEEGAAPTEIEVDLVVGCQPLKPSRTVFQCLNNSGIVFDGRVVVDNNFRTSDPHIYATGTIAKFSRRFGRDIRFELYNSLEIGTLTAESIIAVCSGQETTETVPILGRCRSKVLGCALPEGYKFLYAACATALSPPTLDAPEGGKALQSVSQKGLLQIALDSAGRVHSIAYLGKSTMTTNTLSCLVGLHHSHLNQAVDKFEGGDLKCFIPHLCTDPWSQVVQHEQYRQLRGQLLESTAAAVQAGLPIQQVLEQCQHRLLGFVDKRSSELVGFQAVSVNS